LLGMYFMVALILGQLTTRNRAQQNAERLREERATALYLLSHELNEVTSLDHILQRAARQMEQTFRAQIAILLRDSPERLLDRLHPASTCEPGAEDRRAAAWTFLHGQRAGKFTANLPNAEALFVPLTTSEGRVGVIGLRFSQASAPTIHQLNLLDAFSQQIAFALDRHHLREVSERARLLAESERLSKTLLDSMSHEMRTPIAVIKSAVSNLAQLKDPGLPGPRSAIVTAIQEATERLNRLVGNVLEITRLESGHVKPRFSECDVSDLIHLALAEVERELAQHEVTVRLAPDLPIAPLDFVLMQQALTNLLSNAAVHTRPGTAVEVAARVENDRLVIEVADHGPGIRPEALNRIFEKFYREPGAPTGGTGLGLSLVKGLVEAQGGRVTAKNRAGGGAVFTIQLPLGSIAAVALETGL
jgi:two-component system sensor histidine kinase KdpD